MAAKQAAIRKALKEIAKAKKEAGDGSKALDKLIDEMDKTETDLVNKRLNNEMMKRQQDILTRLLESAKAEREQEKDKKREAQAAREQERKMPPSLEEYIKKREAEIEMYKSVSPTLKPYYKDLVEEYYKSLREN
jgi:glutamate synthase domain-containing protein 1